MVAVVAPGAETARVAVQDCGDGTASALSVLVAVIKQT
jgi:hypothetical protein